MKTVDLYNEHNRENVRLTITDNNFKILEQLESIGGFKRFGLTVYDEGKHIKRGVNDLDIMKAFLNTVFSVNVIDRMEYKNLKTFMI